MKKKSSKQLYFAGYSEESPVGCLRQFCDVIYCILGTFNEVSSILKFNLFFGMRSTFQLFQYSFSKFPNSVMLQSGCLQNLKSEV